MTYFEYVKELRCLFKTPFYQMVKDWCQLSLCIVSIFICGSRKYKLYSCYSKLRCYTGHNNLSSIPQNQILLNSEWKLVKSIKISRNTRHDVSEKGHKTLAARTCYQLLHIISSAWLTTIIRLHINCNEHSSTGTNLPLLCASRHQWLPPDPTSHPLTCRMSHDFPAVTPVQNKSFHLYML